MYIFIFQLPILSDCQCCWSTESLRAHIATFCGRLWLIRSILRASQCSVFKLIENLILWVYYTVRSMGVRGERRDKYWEGKIHVWHSILCRYKGQQEWHNVTDRVSCEHLFDFVGTCVTDIGMRRSRGETGVRTPCDLSEVGSCFDVWWVGEGAKGCFYLIFIFFLARFARQYYT